jgi:hypothetical protein
VRPAATPLILTSGTPENPGCDAPSIVTGLVMSGSGLAGKIDVDGSWMLN